MRINLKSKIVSLEPQQPTKIQQQIHLEQLKRIQETQWTINSIQIKMVYLVVVKQQALVLKHNKIWVTIKHHLVQVSVSLHSLKHLQWILQIQILKMMLLAALVLLLMVVKTLLEEMVTHSVISIKINKIMILETKSSVTQAIMRLHGIVIISCLKDFLALMKWPSKKVTIHSRMHLIRLEMKIKVTNLNP